MNIMINRDSMGRFIKGIRPHNKGKRKYLNLKKIEEEHINGKSILDISKEIKVSDRLIRLRLEEKGLYLRNPYVHSEETKKKIKETLIKKGILPEKRYSGEVWNKGLTIKDERVKRNIQGLLKNRKTQVFPKKDTSIELKIQKFLSLLHIEFLTHYYISNIRHSYQCDILIPIQNGITQKIIIECDGCYWHGCPICNNQSSKQQRKQIAKDNRRKKELIGRGFKVIRLWEHDINKMDIKKFESKLIEVKK